MAAFPPAVLRMPEPEPEPLPEAKDVVLDGGPSTVREGNVSIITMPDGGVVVQIGEDEPEREGDDRFDENLAERLDITELAAIAGELLRGIEQDDSSRDEWLKMHAEGIKLLGLTIEKHGQADSAPLEGMSTVRHPLLLEACLMFQANARGEMLPAAGPAKVRDDRPSPPAGDTAAQQMAAMEDKQRDPLAAALEKDFNHYLTAIAEEYVPDTDRMLFNVGFGGIGVKKVYNCPIRRRPVSESVPMENFIVSNALTDLAKAPRITHKIPMPHSTLRRMQLLGVYRDVEVGLPNQQSANAVEQAKAATAGVSPQPQDPEDQDYTLYECYCELDLDQFAPKQFKHKGLALPYRVVIEESSQQILEIRRNWREDDDQCLARQHFVVYPYVQAFGFYGIGLLHILGNTELSLTAAWREMLDSGMFSNFPGFVYAKGAGRQVSNQFRVPPGGGVGLDVGLDDIRKAVMALPYKDLGPAFVTFIDHIEQLGQRLGGTANIQVGEGRQDAPVGTTLALIEQATKPVGAVLKRLHTAQSKELQLLKERFREDPEAFWRFNKRPTQEWRRDQLLQALDDFDLVPVSDPNNPTGLHRAAKAAAIGQFALQAPGLLDPRKVWLRTAKQMDIDDPEDLLAPPPEPAQPPPDPRIVSAQIKAEIDKMKLEAELAIERMRLQSEANERAQKERIAKLEIDLAKLKLAAEVAKSAEEIERAGLEGALDRFERAEERSNELQGRGESQS